MRRLIRLVEAGRINLKPLFTHRFGLDQISSAYDLFASRRDSVLKVAVGVN
jgi:threonine dehydrogenase-like Zn-dependent dehydrogenase